MSGVVIKLDANPIRPPVVIVENEVNEFCPCDFRPDFIEKAYADPSNDGYKNDFSDFLFRKVAASDTIEFELLKNGVSIAVLNDNTLGEYFNGFAAQPLYVGFIVDWTKVFNTYSGGKYQVRTTSTILGEVEVVTSRYFDVNLFDPLEAYQTIKLETLQYGKFDNSGFDFTDLLPGGWPTSIRIRGSFGEMQPALERDIYEDPSYRDTQNRDEVIRRYSLKISLIPEYLQSRITTEDILANEIFVSSYDVFRDSKLTYIKTPISVDAINEANFDGYGRTSFDVTCSDRQKNIIKSNP